MSVVDRYHEAKKGDKLVIYTRFKRGNLKISRTFLWSERGFPHGTRALLYGDRPVVVYDADQDTFYVKDTFSLLSAQENFRLSEGDFNLKLDEEAFEKTCSKLNFYLRFSTGEGEGHDGRVDW